MLASWPLMEQSALCLWELGTLHLAWRWLEKSNCQTPHQPHRHSPDPESKALDSRLLLTLPICQPSSCHLAFSCCKSWDISYSQIFHSYLLGLDTRQWDFNSWSCSIALKKKKVVYLLWLQRKDRKHGIFKLKVQKEKKIQDFSVFRNVTILMFWFMHFECLGMAIL